jgi:hypothetical protein
MPGCMPVCTCVLQRSTLHNRVIMLGLTVGKVCDGVKAVETQRATRVQKDGMGNWHGWTGEDGGRRWGLDWRICEIEAVRRLSL